MKQYRPTKRAQAVLTTGGILGRGETPQQMYERVIDTIFSIESVWKTDPKVTKRNKQLFADFMADRVLSPGTPTLTNSGREDHRDSALSSCVVIPVNLNKKQEAEQKIKAYYHQNMGSGFDFSPYQDPVRLLEWINALSARETATGRYDRYIGNMGNLHVSHPLVREFIQAKRAKNLRHFNISIDVNREFMDAVKNRDQFHLADGNSIDAHELLWEMAECAHHNGDPGIIDLERMNRDNPVEGLSPYTSTPPCAEMGLSPGETCQFGYLNLYKFMTPGGVNWKKLLQATTILTRALDNAVEVSCGGFPDQSSLEQAVMKRKIGIGVCGLADALIHQGLDYDSDKGRLFARDLLSFINYSSKVASAELAKERGSCGAMEIKNKNKYYAGYLNRFARQPTKTVSESDWRTLADAISKTGKLRNILTTALPPTGRASILMGVTSSIEPLFASSNWNDSTRKMIEKFVGQQAKTNSAKILQQAAKEGTFQNTGLKDVSVLKTAKEIHPYGHMRMVAAVSGDCGVYDEAASKTVNIASDAEVEDVMDIFMLAHYLGLKNVSVYRDGTHINQPEKL